MSATRNDPKYSKFSRAPKGPATHDNAKHDETSENSVDGDGWDRKRVHRPGQVIPLGLLDFAFGLGTAENHREGKEKKKDSARDLERAEAQPRRFQHQLPADEKSKQDRSNPDAPKRASLASPNRDAKDTPSDL